MTGQAIRRRVPAAGARPVSTAIPLMLVLFLIVFIDLVGFGIIIPLLPFYAEHFQASPAVVGVVMATYSMGQLVAAPLWGRASDRRGRRPVLLLTLAGAAIAYVGLGFADSLAALIVARAFGGIMAGNLSAAFAYVADVTTPDNRAKGMGIVGAAFGLGFIVGPAMGGLLAGSDPLAADYRTPALAAAALSLAALILALVHLPESLSPEVRDRLAASSRPGPWADLRRVLAMPTIARPILLTFLATFVFASMEATFAMWSNRTLGWGPAQNGYLFAAVGLLSAAVQGGLMGWLARTLGERRLVVQGAVLLAIGLAMIPASESLPMLALAMVALALGYSFVTPSLTSLVSRGAAADEQGGVMGLVRAASILARVLGPTWGGILFETLGKDWPYLAGSAVMLVVVAVSFGLRAPAVGDGLDRNP